MHSVSQYLVVLPNIGINLGSGPDRLIDIAGTGGLLLKIPLIMPAGFGNSTTTPSSGFFNAGTGTVSGVGNVGESLTASWKLGNLGRPELGVISGAGSTSASLLSPGLVNASTRADAGQSLRRREYRCYGRRLRQHPDPQPRSLVGSGNVGHGNIGDQR